MNFPIKLTITLIVLGIITSLSGSDWFWWIIILFPIIILIRTRKRIEFTYIFLLFFFFLFFGIMFISEGIMSMGDMIVFLYLCIFIFIGGILLGFKKYKGDNMSPFAIFGFIFAIIGTIWISTMMPAPLPLAPTTIPKINTGSISTTGTINTGNIIPKINTGSTINTGVTTPLNSFPNIIIH